MRESHLKPASTLDICLGWRGCFWVVGFLRRNSEGKENPQKLPKRQEGQSHENTYRQDRNAHRDQAITQWGVNAPAVASELPEFESMCR